MSVVPTLPREVYTPPLNTYLSPHMAYVSYTHMPAIQPVQDLDASLLASYSDALRYTSHNRHHLAAAWCDIELAQTLSPDEFAKTVFLFDEAEKHTAESERLQTQTRYIEHPEATQRLYQTKLLRTYLPHFAEVSLGKLDDETLGFQSTAYNVLHTRVIEPLLRSWNDSSDQLRFHKGLLAEMVVMQALNRLNYQQTPELTVTPASAREDCRDTLDGATLSHAFDVKATFPDNRFIPIEVKWSRRNHAPELQYDSKIARVYASDMGDVRSVAHIMGQESRGQLLDSSERQLLHSTSELVINALSKVGYSGRAA